MSIVRPEYADTWRFALHTASSLARSLTHTGDSQQHQQRALGATSTAIVTAIQSVVNARSVQLLLFNASENRFESQGPASHEFELRSFPLGQDVYSTVYLTGTSRRVAAKDGPAPDVASAAAASSAEIDRLVIPIVGAYECRGLLCFNLVSDPARSRADDDRDLAIVKEIGLFATGFLEAAFQQIRQATLSDLVYKYLKVDDLRAFSDVAASLAGSIANAAGAALCYIDIANPKRARLAGLWGFTARHERFDNFSVARSISGQVATSGKPLLLSTLATARNVENLQLLLDEKFISAVAVPVFGKDLKGGLSVYSKDPRGFHPTTVQLLTRVGMLIGALTEARMQAIHIDALVTELGHAGHSLRNPMKAVGDDVKALGRLLGGEQASPEARRVLENTYTELERANRRITSMLYSRKGILDITGLKKTSVHVSEVLESCVRRHESHAQARNIRIVLFDSAKNLPIINGDEDKIDLLFDNLIENAVKYGWEKHPIEIRGEFSARELKVSVADKGLGVPTEYYPLIFQGYTRSPTLDSTRYIHGTGLGLQIAKLIAEAHEGSITVTSKQFLDDWQRLERQEGFETVFSVILPRKRAHQ